MSAQKFTYTASIPSEELDDWGAVPVPVSDIASRLRGRELIVNKEEGSEVGVWECTPGKWVRQVVDAEICTFLQGHAVFHPEEGESIDIKAGDVVFFPAESKGVWEIIETVRKIYLNYNMKK